MPGPSRFLDTYLRFFKRPMAKRGLRIASLPIAQELAADTSRFENARMVRLAMMYLYNEGIGGDYAEFGVFDGRTFTEAFYAADDLGLGMRFFAYDSFKGLPNDEGPFQTGQFGAPREALDANIKAHHIPPERVEVVQGFFDETLREQSEPSEVAVAFIDSDLYESAVLALDFLTNRLVDGAVLCFDDWFCFRGSPEEGEQRACQEWLIANPGLELVPYR